MKKIDFRKGTGTFVLGWYMMLICLVVAVVLIDQYSKYDNALTTQIAADSIADGSAAYASMLSESNQDLFYDDVNTKAQDIATLIEDETKIEAISELTIDEDAVKNEHEVNVNLVTDNTKIYGNFTQIYGLEDSDTETYPILRSATTKFTVNPLAYIGQGEGGDVTFYTDPSQYNTYSAYLSSLTCYATTFVGRPYQRSGTDLNNGTDCSGFVQGIWSHFGISITRSTYSQINDGTAVNPHGSEADLQLGDCIYVQKQGMTDGLPNQHVVMYIGNGKVVHASNSAPYPQGGIKISDLAPYLTGSCGVVIGVRRFLTEEEFNTYHTDDDTDD